MCGTFKKTIKKRTFFFEKGISNIQVNISENLITDDYCPKKLTSIKLKQQLPKSGYNSNDLKAVEKAYQNLPDAASMMLINIDHYCFQTVLSSKMPIWASC